MDAAIAAVITAAGSSSRMGGGIKKEYRPLGPAFIDDEGKPLTVLGAAVAAFACCPRIGIIVITVPLAPNGGDRPSPDAPTGACPDRPSPDVPAGDPDRVSPQEAAARAALPSRLLRADARSRLLFVAGGPTRRASVHRALCLLSAYNPNYVLIHDGGRPWVDNALIERTMDMVIRHGAAAPLLPLTETPKELDGTGFIKRHLRRVSVGTAQTPQGFAFPGILRAHALAAERELRESWEYTDDAEVWGEFVGPVAVVEGSPRNRKITFPEDLDIRQS